MSEPTSSVPSALQAELDAAINIKANQMATNDADATFNDLLSALFTSKAAAANGEEESYAEDAYKLAKTARERYRVFRIVHYTRRLTENAAREVLAAVEKLTA